MPWSKILVGFDGSENALRAVKYVGEMFATLKDVEVTLLGIYERIPRHDLEGSHVGIIKLKESVHALEVAREQGKEQIKEAARILIEAGISQDRVHIKYVERRSTVPKDIINEVREGDYGTVVVGRRGISNIRGFIFGSVSSTLVAHLQGYTVCVVE